jgi:hypothetical protein
MEKTFQFVDSRKVDKTTRKQIRSHVMKGKNAGRKLHRSSRLVGRRRYDHCSSFQRIACVTDDEQTNEERGYSGYAMIARNIQNSLLTLSFPFKFELSPHSIKVVNQCKYDSLE